LYFFGRYADLTSIDASTGYSLNKLNTWYHIACTISKGTVKVYVNGSLIKTLTLSKLPTGSQTMIHNLLAESNWSADPCSNCRISDFRIYATCLSDSDIQELYNKPISIDNQGVMFAVEAVEESASPVKFNKTGVVEANQIGEYLHNYFDYNNPMTTDILQRVSVEKLIENNGYEKEVDWIERQLKAPKEVDPRLERISSMMMKKYNLHYGNAKNINDFIKKYADGFFDIIDQTYDKLYGTVPITEKMRKNLIKSFKLIVNKEYVDVILDENNRRLGKVKKNGRSGWPFRIFRLRKRRVIN
jgi:hypothetical protein